MTELNGIEMNQFGCIQLIDFWSIATRDSSWWSLPQRDKPPVANMVEYSRLLSQPDDVGECLLRWTLALDRSDEVPWKLVEPWRQRLTRLVAAGVTLKACWPRPWSVAVERWIGARLYLSTVTNLSRHSSLSSILCSQIGRHGEQLAQWPTLLDAALRRCYLDDNSLLLVPKTTLAVPIDHFSRRAKLHRVHVQFDDRGSLANWVDQFIRQVERIDDLSEFSQFTERLNNSLVLSPAVDASTVEHRARPLQDTIACALSDRLIVLHARPGGHIASLLAARLACEEFPCGTVYVASAFGARGAAGDVTRDTSEWLERGAVGWLVHCKESLIEREIAGCRSTARSTRSSQAPCLPLSSLLPTKRRAADWPYLAHCTRGNAGQLPEESLEHYLDRAWNSGQVANSHPLITLEQIMQDRCLRGSSQWTRTNEVCVSFSAVPLPELLSRRQFRSHLGRWDWEPYGLLILRNELVARGARAVLYGDECEYGQLSIDDQPFFQPRGKLDRRSQQDWSSELEWRLLGNLSLSNVPLAAMMLFVATQAQAQQMARRWSWPVIWNDL